VAADVPKATKSLESAQKLSSETNGMLLASYRRDLANYVKGLVNSLKKQVGVWESFTCVVDMYEMLNGRSTGETEKSRQKIQISLVREISGAKRHQEGLVQLVGEGIGRSCPNATSLKKLGNWTM
jgi:hypothetical protein